MITYGYQGPVYSAPSNIPDPISFTNTADNERIYFEVCRDDTSHVSQLYRIASSISHLIPAINTPALNDISSRYLREQPNLGPTWDKPQQVTKVILIFNPDSPNENGVELAPDSYERTLKIFNKINELGESKLISPKHLGNTVIIKVNVSFNEFFD